MGWLLAWLIFSLLAAYETGALAMHAGSEWTPARALAWLIGSAGSLGALLMRAVRQAQPGMLRPVLGLSLLALAGCLWGLYGSGHSPGWVTTAIFGAAYSFACLFVGCIATLLAWRRHAAHEERVALARVERERQGRLERIRAETSAAAAAASADDGLGPDSDFTLPARPKWDD